MVAGCRDPLWENPAHITHALHQVRIGHIPNENGHRIHNTKTVFLPASRTAKSLDCSKDGFTTSQEICLQTHTRCKTPNAPGCLHQYQPLLLRVQYQPSLHCTNTVSYEYAEAFAIRHLAQDIMWDLSAYFQCQHKVMRLSLA